MLNGVLDKILLYNWSMALRGHKVPKPTSVIQCFPRTIPSPQQLLMSDLKRKRNVDDEGNHVPADDGTVDAEASPQKQQQKLEESPTSSQTACSSTPQAPSEETQRCHGTAVEATTSKSTDAPSSSAASSSTKGDPATIVICGKEVMLKATGGRKKRKHPMETLIILAYKGRLALACKANDMVAALDIHREMKSKGIKQDLSVSRYWRNFAFFLVSFVVEL